MKEFAWDKRNVDFLRAHYRVDMSSVEIGLAIGCPAVKVRVKAQRLGLAKSTTGSPYDGAADLRELQEDALAPTAEIIVFPEKALKPEAAKGAAGNKRRKAGLPAMHFGPSASANPVPPTPLPPYVPQTSRHAVRFLDRAQNECPAILDERVPILQRLVCGAPRGFDLNRSQRPQRHRQRRGVDQDGFRPRTPRAALAADVAAYRRQLDLAGPRQHQE